MMRKLFLASIVLAVACIAQAQTIKVAPLLKKGIVKNSTITVTTNTAGKQVTITSAGRYTVSEDTKDGHIVDCIITDLTNDAKADDVVGRLLSASTEMMKGVNERIVVDKDGVATGIKNYADVKKQSEKACGKLIDALLEEAPQLGEMMSKETLMKQVMGQLTEEAMVAAAKVSASPLALNGKTINTGMEDEYVNQQGMKMKRTYTVTDGVISSTATLNMTRDELKQIVISQVEKIMPGQAETIKQNIDMVMATGLVKFNATEKATYELADDGWVKSINMESTTETMGQKVTAITKVELK